MSESEKNRINRELRRKEMERVIWTPRYSHWRHGGSYVTNIVFPSGACGCIASAAHTRSGKFESACFDLGTFPTRQAAAFAERAYAMKLWREFDKEVAV